METSPAKWLAPAELLAGIAVARTVAAGRSIDAAIQHVRQGPADLAALDYDAAIRLASAHTWELFSAHPDDSVAVRATLSALMRATDPDWSRDADRGRARALDGLDDDSRQCFRLGDLLETTDEAVAWWLEAALWRRSRRDERKRAAGLDAEMRSLELERQALAGTGLTVRWMAVEDATAGYDIQTWRETEAAVAEVTTTDGRHWRKHFVEVKSALSGEVFLSRNEWDFASTRAGLWTLHVWRKGNLPNEIEVTTMGPHVPTDGGRGRWDGMRVPSAVLRS